MVFEIFSQGLFPNGILHYIIGGIIIGIGVSLIYLFAGLKSGASSFFTTTWSYVVNHPYFHEKKFKESRSWRILFSLGLIIGALSFTYLINNGKIFITQVGWIRLAVGGLLVGIGTRLSRGCTSGHGICGISSLNKASIISTVVFLIIAIITALFVKSLGVFP